MNVNVASPSKYLTTQCSPFFSWWWEMIECPHNGRKRGQWHGHCEVTRGYSGPVADWWERGSPVSSWCSDLWRLKLWRAKANIWGGHYCIMTQLISKINSRWIAYIVPKRDVLSVRERQKKPEKNSGRVERHGPPAVTTPGRGSRT